MKTGDVVILKTKIVESKDGLWSASSNVDGLTIIEGKADIGGCVLARDYRGEIHCVNPDLFEVVWTAEEAVAKRLMEPEPFIPVSHEEVMSRFHQALAKAMAVNLDNEIMNSMISTANAEVAKRLARHLGMEGKE